MNKIFTKIICLIFVLAIIWLALFITDYSRATQLKEPIFALPKGGALADDGGSGTYIGLGYTVEVKKYIDSDFGVCIESVEMKFFGKVIAASIS